MPTVSAYRGVRYDLGDVGSLSDVIAPCNQSGASFVGNDHADTLCLQWLC